MFLQGCRQSDGAAGDDSARNEALQRVVIFRDRDEECNRLASNRYLVTFAFGNPPQPFAGVLPKLSYTDLLHVLHDSLSLIHI